MEKRLISFQETGLKFAEFNLVVNPRINFNYKEFTKNLRKY